MKIDLVIPTKGRHQDLKRCLLVLELLVREGRADAFDIGVCISDSSEVEISRDFFRETYPSLRIAYQNAPAINRFVDNLKNAVFLSSADYVWLMGDDDFVLQDAFLELHDLLKDSPSLIHVNAFLRNSLKRKEELLVSYGKRDQPIHADVPFYRWVEELTYMSCLIFSREIIQDRTTWSEVSQNEVASHLRFVCKAVSRGDVIATQKPYVAIEKNDEVNSEWNGNWCVLLGYEIPRVRHCFIVSGKPKPAKLVLRKRDFKYVINQELKMHFVLSVFRISYPSLAKEATGFLNYYASVRIIKLLIYGITSPAWVRSILRKVGTLFDPRCAQLR